jgi:hypothetical protein
LPVFFIEVTRVDLKSGVEPPQSEFARLRVLPEMV